MRYIASDTYSIRDVERIAESGKVCGVVVGDPYCQKRMFEYGETGLVKVVERAAELGLGVIYQTPCYMTDRVFDKNMMFVRYLADNDLCSGGVMVQDVGFAHELHALRPELNLIWSQVSRTRNSADNTMFYSFLKKTGISAVELTKPELAGHLKGIGLTPVFTDRLIQYSTVNRECYYIHETGQWDRNCKRGCLGRDIRLVNEGRNMNMKVDGYQLDRAFEEIVLTGHVDEEDTVIHRGRDMDTILSEIGSC